MESHFPVRANRKIYSALPGKMLFFVDFDLQQRYIVNKKENMLQMVTGFAAVFSRRELACFILNLIFTMDCRFMMRGRGLGPQASIKRRVTTNKNKLILTNRQYPNKDNFLSRSEWKARSTQYYYYICIECYSIPN